MTRNNRKKPVYIKPDVHKLLWKFKVQYDVNIEDLANECLKTVLGDRETVERIVETLRVLTA